LVSGVAVYVKQQRKKIRKRLEGVEAHIITPNLLRKTLFYSAPKTVQFVFLKGALLESYLGLNLDGRCWMDTLSLWFLYQP